MFDLLFVFIFFCFCKDSTALYIFINVSRATTLIFTHIHGSLRHLLFRNQYLVRQHTSFVLLTPVLGKDEHVIYLKILIRNVDCMLFSLLSASHHLQTQFLFQVLRHLPSEKQVILTFFLPFSHFPLWQFIAQQGSFPQGSFLDIRIPR